MRQSVTKAVIPVAGLGTRLLPFTKAVPKELIPIVDTPVIQLIVQEAIDAGIRDIIFVSSAKKQAVHNYFDYQELLDEKQDKPQVKQLLAQITSGVNFISVWQPKPLGLGNAILCAKSIIGDEPFAVMLPDDLILTKKFNCLQQLLLARKKFSGNVLGIMSVSKQDVSKYGIIKSKRAGSPEKFLGAASCVQVQDLHEKPSLSVAFSQLAIIGRYILSPTVFEVLEKTPVGFSKELQLTDALRILVKQESIYGVLFEGQRFDIGDTLGWLQANIVVASQQKAVKKEFLAWGRKFFGL
jgi:UTP--glucose-1-phosphate uridylyltransferase